jgi:hypothetical protein
VLFLVRAVRDLELSTAVTALVVVGGGATSIAASLLLVRWAPGLPSPVAMIGAAFVLGLAAIDIGLTRHAGLSAALFCVLAAASTCYVVYWRSYRQEIVPPDRLGRVSAACRSLAYAGGRRRDGRRRAAAGGRRRHGAALRPRRVAVCGRSAGRGRRAAHGERAGAA